MSDVSSIVIISSSQVAYTVVSWTEGTFADVDVVGVSCIDGTVSDVDVVCIRLSYGIIVSPSS